MDDKHCWPCDQAIINKKPPCPLQCKSPKCPSYKKPPPPNLKEKIMIWVMAGPGFDTRSLCDSMASKYNLKHLCTGDLVRAEIKSESVRAKCLISVVERGELVPNDQILSFLKQEMYATAKTVQGYIIDKYPREERQGFDFERCIAPVSLVINLQVSDETLTKKLLARGRKLERISDNPDAIKIRLREFHHYNKHIVDQYPHRLITVNAESLDIGAQITKAIDEVVAKHNAKLEAEKKEKALWPQPNQGSTSALHQF